MTIEPLNKGHDRGGFDCGQELLNHYLKTQAGQDAKRNLAVCFVLVGAGAQVKGYYTLSNAAIPRQDLPEDILKRLPPSYSSLPVTLLGRLAVDISTKGKGLGSMLLIDALKRSFMVSQESIGSMAVVVDPIDEQASNFYQQYGFILLPDSRKMFLPMKTVAKVFMHQ